MDLSRIVLNAEVKSSLFSSEVRSCSQTSQNASCCSCSYAVITSDKAIYWTNSKTTRDVSIIYSDPGLNKSEFPFPKLLKVKNCFLEIVLQAKERHQEVSLSLRAASLPT